MVTVPAPNPSPLRSVTWHSPWHGPSDHTWGTVKKQQAGAGVGSLEVSVKGTNVPLWDG